MGIDNKINLAGVRRDLVKSVCRNNHSCLTARLSEKVCIFFDHPMIILLIITSAWRLPESEI